MIEGLRPSGLWVAVAVAALFGGSAGAEVPDRLVERLKGQRAREPWAVEPGVQGDAGGRPARPGVTAAAALLLPSDDREEE